MTGCRTVLTVEGGLCFSLHSVRTRVGHTSEQHTESVVKGPVDVCRGTYGVGHFGTWTVEVLFTQPRLFPHAVWKRTVEGLLHFLVLRKLKVRRQEVSLSKGGKFPLLCKVFSVKFKMGL